MNSSYSKPFNLESRTFGFAKKCRVFIKSLPKSSIAVSDIDQLLRSSGSVGANYIEANEALSNKDFIMRIKICRKEAKESGYWLSLLESESETENTPRKELFQEAMELTKIFSSILQKCQ